MNRLSEFRAYTHTRGHLHLYGEACVHAFVSFVVVTELRLCVILLGLLIVSRTQVKWPMEVAE